MENNKNLKNFIKTTIREFLNEQKNINEIFGWSKKEKEEKYYKEKIEQAKKEISNYNFERIFKQPSENKNNKELQMLVDIVLKDASYSLQTVKLLMPDLFERREGTGAMAAVFNYKGKYINGIVPSNFWFLVQGSQELMKDVDAKKRMEQELENFIKER